MGRQGYVTQCEHTDRPYVYLVQESLEQATPFVPLAFTEREFAEAYAERVGGSVVAVELRRGW